MIHLTGYEDSLREQIASQMESIQSLRDIEQGIRESLQEVGKVIITYWLENYRSVIQRPSGRVPGAMTQPAMSVSIKPGCERCREQLIINGSCMSVRVAAIVIIQWMKHWAYVRMR